MGLSKRIWIENDPAYEHVREAYRDEMEKHLEQFRHRLPEKKFCVIEGKRRIDKTWNLAVDQACKQLNAELVYINSGLFFKTSIERDAVKLLACKLHPDLFEKYGLKPPKRCPRCQAELRIKLTRKGSSAGTCFWGCVAYPNCNHTEDCTSEESERHLRFRERTRKRPHV